MFYDNKDVHTARRCGVAVSQELLSCLQGFFAFSLELVTPQQLLSVLAEKAFGNSDDDDAPDNARILSFADSARQTARSIFRKPTSTRTMMNRQQDESFDPLAAGPDEILFDTLLQDYLTYDPLFAEAQAAQPQTSS